MIISLLAKFGWFFGEKKDFRPKKHFSAKRKNSQFSVILAGTRSVAGWLESFFDGPEGPTKFCWKQSKIKGTYNSQVVMARNGQKSGQAPENDP